MCFVLCIERQTFGFVCIQSGHGEQEDINGHDAESGCWSALQTIHFPHTTEHEVFTHHLSLCLFTCKLKKEADPNIIYWLSYSIHSKYSVRVKVMWLKFAAQLPWQKKKTSHLT